MQCTSLPARACPLQLGGGARSLGGSGGSSRRRGLDLPRRRTGGVFVAAALERKAKDEQLKVPDAAPAGPAPPQPPQPQAPQASRQGRRGGGHYIIT